MEIKKITVMGAGLMGTQIAVLAARSGYEVICYDINKEMLQQAEEFTKNWVFDRIRKGKISQVDGKEIQGRLTFTETLSLAGCETDLVIEAVSDRESIKRQALQEIDAFTPERCIYASNSSYIVSSRFAQAVKRPDKVLNVHFFNPALVMKIVEVVRSTHVSEETFQTAFQFVKSLGKTPIPIEKEIYGFVVNRIFSALTREACYLVDLGIASAEDVDTAVKGALGHAMGPFETLDMTGIDLEYNVYMERFRDSGNKEDLPAACLAQHYAKGEFGRKAGKGFYAYKDVKGGSE